MAAARAPLVQPRCHPRHGIRSAVPRGDAPARRQRAPWRHAPACRAVSACLPCYRQRWTAPIAR
ncbi:conserved hypothetical protein [Ricinus communis]|uniref:Uncharacterized protein n=1 Tax=Ricinus communis TaxID=3988 RepID=B9T921_RICCO|nr:conserved hypothetical protein [Ricinus communis]